jgi:hypothetical protein
MRVTPLNPGQPIAEGGRQPIDREWYAWLRRLIDALGFTPAAPMYADLYVPFSAMDTTGAALSLLGVAGNIQWLAFPDGSTQEVRADARLPNNYRNGSPLQWFLEWMPISDDAGSVVWSVEWSNAASGFDFSQTTTQNVTVLTSEPGSELGFKIVRTALAEIPGTGLVKGSHLLVEISRLGASASDTYPTSAMLLGLGIKYQAEGIGWEVAHP